jgi:hypothetical protein
MRYLKVLAFVGVLMLTASHANAQRVAIGIGMGGPGYYGPAPICDYGYYNYYPYACAPYGYYGPEWFNSGFFIGAGPWFGGFRGGFRGRDFDRGRDFRGGFNGRQGFNNRGFQGRQGFNNRGSAPVNRGGSFQRGPSSGSFNRGGSTGGGFRSGGGGGSVRGSGGGGGSRGSGGHR